MSNAIRHSPMRQAVRQHGLGLLAIAIVAGGVYLNGIPTPFIWDDDWLIQSNEGIRHLGNIPEFFAPRYWQRFHEEYFRSFPGRSYRPVAEISFALDYRIWGLNPVGFHVTNVLLHIANCVLAYVLAYRIFGHRRIAIFSTLLFAAHPLHTEAVVWVKVRSQLMAVTFVLTAVLMYARYAERPGARRAVALYIGAVVCFGLAILSKATAIILPALLVLYVWCFVPRTQWRRHLLSLLPFAGAVLMFFALDPLMPFMPRSTPAPATYLGAVIIVLGQYIRLFLAPVGLCLDRYWHIHAGELLPPLLPTAPFVLALIAGAVLAARRSKTVLFALGWFVVALAPAFRVAFMGRAIAESRVYGPSIGLCMVFGFLLHRLAEFRLTWLSARLRARLAWALCILVVLVCSGLTIARNADWADAFGLWRDTVEKNPSSWHAQIRVARWYFHADPPQYDKAVEHLEVVAELRPQDTEALLQLGGLYQQMGEYDKALKYYRKLLATDNSNVNVRVRLGVLFGEQGDDQKAEWYLRRAASMDPRCVDAHYNLGVLYGNKKDYERAIAAFERAVHLRPNNVGIHQDLAAAYAAAGSIDRAAAEYGRSVAIDPANAEGWLALGACREQLGDVHAAAEAFRRCAQLNSPLAEQAEEYLSRLAGDPRMRE